MASDKCVCDHCKYRHSWDCDDRLAYPKGGCKEFALDWDTLTHKQQVAVQRVLSNNSYDRPRERFDWDW